MRWATLAVPAARAAEVATVVDRRTTHAHLDPLLAAEGRNDFVTTVAPWLSRIHAGG